MIRLLGVGYQEHDKATGALSGTAEIPKGVIWDNLLFGNRRADHPISDGLRIDPGPQFGPNRPDLSLACDSVAPGNTGAADGEKLVSDDLF